MPKTYEPIATTTTTSNVSEVEFTSIPQGYTDLIIVRQGSQGGSPGNMSMQVGNNSYDTGNNYSGTQLFGNGSSSATDRFSNDSRWYINYNNSSGQTMSIYQIMNYSNTTTNKTMLSRNSDGAYYVSAYVFLWRSTAAINRVKLYHFTSNILSGTVFTLYGIKAA